MVLCTSVYIASLLTQYWVLSAPLAGMPSVLAEDKANVSKRGLEREHSR